MVSAMLSSLVKKGRAVTSFATYIYAVDVDYGNFFRTLQECFLSLAYAHVAIIVHPISVVASITVNLIVN